MKTYKVEYYLNDYKYVVRVKASSPFYARKKIERDVKIWSIKPMLHIDSVTEVQRRP